MPTVETMTLIELLRFLGILFGGALLGVCVGVVEAWLTGSPLQDAVGKSGLIGAAVTFGGLILGAWRFGRMDAIHPPCRCGKSAWDDFKMGSSATFPNIWECTCGRKYCWPKSGWWYEIDHAERARLFFRRPPLGHWRAATDNEIANNTLGGIRRPADGPPKPSV